MKKENNHIGRLVRNIYLKIMEEPHQRLTELGFDELNGSYSIIFQNIGNGARPSEIAAKAQTTKQNVKYLLEVMEQKGFVRRKNDDQDGRAWLFKLTDKGALYQKKGLQIIESIEKEWAKKMGVEKYNRMKHDLMILNEIISNE